MRGGQVKTGERLVLSAAELMRLAEVICPRYRALVLLAAFSGLRFGELAALRRGDLDLTSGRDERPRPAARVQDRY